MTDADDEATSKREDIAHPVEAMAHAASKVGVDFYRAFKDANSGDPRREIRGLAQMTVLNMREGEFPGRDFQKLPVHLPDTEKEMRALALSVAPADRAMRDDLHVWARHNRDLQVKAAIALETTVGVFRRADAVLSDESCTDEELGLWCDQMVAHVLAVWKVDIRTAPTEAKAITAWAVEVVARFNIAPDWLSDTGKPASTFEPAKHRRAGNPFGRPFRSRGYGGDDD